MDAIEAMYAGWAAGRDEGGGEHWGDVTAEPRGVDYLEVSANGVPAMWLDPHGAAAGRAMDPALTAPTFEDNAATDLFFTREMIRELIKAYLPEGVSGWTRK